MRFAEHLQLALEDFARFYEKIADVVFGNRERAEHHDLQVESDASAHQNAPIGHLLLEKLQLCRGDVEKHEELLFGAHIIVKERV